MTQFYYHTNCTNSASVGEYGEAIHQMMNSLHLREISNARFISKYAKDAGIVAEALVVANCERAVQFKNDFSVTCYSGVFVGVPCLVVRASAIEHIFIPQDHGHLVCDATTFEARDEKADSLLQMILNDKAWDKLKTISKRKAFLSSFVQQHITEFTEYNLLLENVLEPDGVMDKAILEIDEKIILPARRMSKIGSA